MATTPAVAPEPQAPINHFGRIVGALFNPKATFEDIAKRPGISWVVVFLLMITLGILVSAYLNRKMDWEGYIRQRAEKNTRFAQLPEEQKQRAVSSQAKWSPQVSYVFGVLRFPAIVLCASAFYLGALNLFYSANLRFQQVFSITALANAGPAIIASVLILITLMFKPVGEVTPETMLASHLGVFLGNDAPTWQLSLASSVELFDLWGNVLAAIGLSAANPKKITLSSGAVAVFGGWLLWVLIKTGAAFIFS